MQLLININTLLLLLFIEINCEDISDRHTNETVIKKISEHSIGDTLMTDSNKASLDTSLPAQTNSSILNSVVNSILIPISEKPKIVGGVKAKNIQWPWMAALMKKNKDKPFCGGTLIGRQTIVTAAHCVKGESASRFFVRLGADDLTRIHGSQSKDMAIKSIRIHSKYKFPNNDIAIIKLKSKVKYSKYIKPIRLALSKYDYTGKSATVAGWGTTRYGGNVSSRLRHVGLKVWKNTRCAGAIKDNKVTSSMICAGDTSGTRKDACQGDSGGPLMHRDDTGWRLIGIVSFGEKCGDPRKPGVYTRVTKYLKWIKSHS